VKKLWVLRQVFLVIVVKDKMIVIMFSSKLNRTKEIDPNT
jgi:hypothetical protein